MLRMLSAPDPRDDMPSAWTLVSTWTMSFGRNSRIWRLLRVVMSTRPEPHSLGKLRKPAQLVRREDAAGNAQPQHEGVLCGGDIEEAMKFEAEEVIYRWRLVLCGVGKQIVPHARGFSSNFQSSSRHRSETGVPK